MKKLLVYIAIFIVYGGGGLIAQKYQPKYQKEDDKVFKSLTTRIDDDGWIEFKKEAKLNPNSFFKDYATNLGLGQHYDFKAMQDETDKKQQRHQHYQLYYKNIAVEGIIYSIHSDASGLSIAHGKIPDGLDHDVAKPMSEVMALDYALANMKLTLDDLNKSGKKKPTGTLLLARVANEVI